MKDKYKIYISNLDKKFKYLVNTDNKYYYKIHYKQFSHTPFLHSINKYNQYNEYNLNEFTLFWYKDIIEILESK